jgi:hypothetical protein
MAQLVRTTGTSGRRTAPGTRWTTSSAVSVVETTSSTASMTCSAMPSGSSATCTASTARRSTSRLGAVLRRRQVRGEAGRSARGRRPRPRHDPGLGDARGAAGDRERVRDDSDATRLPSPRWPVAKSDLPQLRFVPLRHWLRSARPGLVGGAAHEPCDQQRINHSAHPHHRETQLLRHW